MTRVGPRRPSHLQAAPKVDARQAERELPPHDVVLSKRALSFDRNVDGLGPELQLSRARTVLGFLRYALEPEALEPLQPAREEARVEPEAAEPIGEAAYQDVNTFQTNWDAIEYGRPAVHPARMRFNDQTVQKFISEFKDNVLSVNTLTLTIPTEDTVLLLKNYVRARELGSNILVLDPASVWSLEWPVNVETAAILRRAAEAFNVDERDIAFGGATLDDYRVLVDAAAPESLRAEPERRQLFDLLGTLRNYYPSLEVAQVLAAQPELQEGVRDFLERSRGPRDIQRLASRLLKLDTPVEHPVDAPVSQPRLQELPPLVDRRQADPTAGEIILPSGPLAESSPPGVDYQSLYETDHHAYFVTAATDENLKRLKGGWVLRHWMSDLNRRRKPVDVGEIANFIARHIEVGKPTPNDLAEALNSLVSSQSPLIARNDSDVLPLLRLAKVFDRAPETISIRRRDGSLSTLAEWAAELNLPRHRSPPPPDPSPAVATFSLTAPKTITEKLAALQWLQGTDATSPAFSQVLEAARLLLDTQGLAPLDWHALSATRRRMLVKALCSDQHPAAAAMLTGLFTRNAADGVAEQLMAQGTPPAQAATWAGHAKALEALDPAQQRFVTGALDFEHLPLRLELAKTEALTPQALSTMYGRWSPRGEAETLRALADWALLKGGAAKVAVQDFFNDGFARGLLSGASIGEALHGPRGEALNPPGSMASLLKVAQTLVRASSDERPQAVASLEAALRATAPFIPRAQLVSWLLSTLHEEELSQVLALDLADTELGGVPATPWQVQPLTLRALPAQPHPAADLWNSLEGLSSFAYVEGITPHELDLRQVRARYPLVAHGLRTQRAALEMAIARAYLNGQPFNDRSEAINAEALALVDRALASELRAAATADEKMKVYSVGRALLDDQREWYQRIKDQFEVE